MANPQTENGFTKVANEIFDAMLKWHLSSYEHRMLIFIMRKTYSWGKKTDKIALSQFSEALGIKKTHVSRTLKLLLAQNIITKGGNERQREWGIQKDYDKWVKLPKELRTHSPSVTKRGNDKMLPKGVKQITKRGNTSLPKGVHTKETTTKETTTKELAKVPAGTLRADEWQEVIDAWEPVNAFYLNFYKNKTQRQAIVDIVKKVGKEQLLKYIKVLPKTNKTAFFPNVTTPIQLRDKWSALEDALIKKKAELDGRNRSDVQKVDKLPTFIKTPQ